LKDAAAETFLTLGEYMEQLNVDEGQFFGYDGTTLLRNEV